MASILVKAMLGLATAGFVNIIYNLYKVRMHVRRVKTKHGVVSYGLRAMFEHSFMIVSLSTSKPIQFWRSKTDVVQDILPHSFLFGHLIVIDKVMKKYNLPPDLHSHWLPILFLQEYPELAKKGILYLDVWPISEPLLAIYHPDLLTQLTEGNFPKSPLMTMEMGPVTGAKDLLTLEGQQWKRSRAMFNPGFSAKNITSLIPEFVEEIEMFRDKMKEAAHTGEVIKLEDWTTPLAVDVIGRAVLGVRLDSQIKPPPLVQTMQLQVPLLYNKLDFYKLFNPVRYYKLWLYRRRFRKLLIPYIQEAARTYDTSTGPKTVLRLALKERASEIKSSTSRINDFIEDQVGQFWIFLFAGHDTTAITLAFCFYLLSRNPEKAAILRAEHDRVLGKDPTRAAEAFRNDPNLVHQLPYTTAVFKETLRLCPPVTGGVRSPSKGFFVTHPETGERFPTWGFMVNAAGAIMQRIPEYWPEPNKFLPERWMVKDPTDPLYPRKGAYRPFEAGQRNCIGQELVSLEVRLVLALTVREFEVEDAYPDDGLSFLGEKAFQVDIPESIVTAHARDRMPVTIKAR